MGFGVRDVGWTLPFGEELLYFSSAGCWRMTSLLNRRKEKPRNLAFINDEFAPHCCICSLCGGFSSGDRGHRLTDG